MTVGRCDRQAAEIAGRAHSLVFQDTPAGDTLLHVNIETQKEEPKTVTTVSRTLPDGRLVELVASRNERKTRLAVGGPDGFAVVDHIDAPNGERWIPIPYENNLIQHGVLHLAEGPEPCGSLASLVGEITAYLVIDVVLEGKRKAVPIKLLAAKLIAKAGKDIERPITARYVGSLLRKRLHLSTYRRSGSYLWPLVKPERLLVLALRYGIEPEGILALGAVERGLQDIGDVVPEDEEEEAEGSEAGEPLTQ